ncbi:hypothetical protein PSPO01_09381 [Paraphaeosphaeria sporulosa]
MWTSAKPASHWKISRKLFEKTSR